MARYNSDGTPDESFGNNGIVQYDLGADELVSDVALQSDGMMVVAGKQSTDTDANFLIVRFKSNGDVDDTFGDLGKVITDLGGFDGVRAIANPKGS